VRGLGEALEQGTLRVPFAELFTGVWRLAMTPALRRELTWPSHVRVVGIGGSTLGGSGKTPLAIACAAELARLGASTILVGHAHRARLDVARLVKDGDRLDQVGDEALVAARALRAAGVGVVVGPTRQEALDLAASLACVLVLDGVAQTVPLPTNLSLLAVDPAEPWGTRCALPPRGDLRADRSHLIDVCDAVVPVGDLPEPLSAEWSKISAMREVARTRVLGEGARLASGDLIAWEALSRERVGLLTALARPERVFRSLAGKGVRPRAVLRSPDHGPMGAGFAKKAVKAAREAGIVLWLATPKCSVHVERERFNGRDRPCADSLGAPLATLEHGLVLSAPLVARLRRLAMP
jgi:tetraacyldisaccharide-1-P 4'-kinase